jgi:hypothetical protein
MIMIALQLTLIITAAHKPGRLLALCVPRMSSVPVTSGVASLPSGRDDHRSCACGSSSS